MTAKQLKKIDKALKRMASGKLTKKEQVALEESRKKWDEAVKPLLDAIRASTRLTAEDYAVTVLPVD